MEKKKANGTSILENNHDLGTAVREVNRIGNHDLGTAVREVNRIGNYNEDNIKTYYDSYKTYLIWPIFQVYI